METKEALREELKKRRADVSLEDRKTVEDIIADNFLEAVKLPSESVVALYWPLGDELSTIALAHRLRDSGHTVVLPAVETEGGLLTFREWTPDVPLVKGRHGIMEPPTTQEILVPELVVAPLLGVDDAGHRLGYGGGYYDRTIAGLRQDGGFLGYLGLCYSFQNVAELPIEEHDQPLDAVMSEKGVHSFNRSAA